MNKYTRLLFCLLFFAGCGPAADENAFIALERTDEVAPFVEVVDHIDLIPLESCPEASAGDRPLFALGDGGFILMDASEPRLSHFGPDGAFLNPIVLDVDDESTCVPSYSVQVLDDEVTVFATDGIRTFAMDGTLLWQDDTTACNGPAWRVPEGILLDYGYGAGPDRAALIGPDGSRKDFLPTEANVISLTLDTPVFTEWDGTVYFLDSYAPVVQRYRDGAVTEALHFDFGEFELPDKFFQMDDAYNAMEYMFSLPAGFALLRRYLRNDRYQFVEVVIQKDLAVSFCYGFTDGNAWKWFSLGKQEASPFVGTQMALDGNALYFLLRPDVLAGDGHGLDGALKPLRALISNPEALEGIRPGDNPVVARIILK